MSITPQGDYLCPDCKHPLHGPENCPGFITTYHGDSSTRQEGCLCRRRPLLEISESEARSRARVGAPVFGHAFHPFEISTFHPNGFQAWASEGFRFEAVRFYKPDNSTEEPAPVKMERTPALDAHWKGFFWCHTCSLYAGLEMNHKGHELERL